MHKLTQTGYKTPGGRFAVPRTAIISEQSEAYDRGRARDEALTKVPDLRSVSCRGRATTAAAAERQLPSNIYTRAFTIN